MDAQLPVWPARVSRDEARKQKERSREFEHHLRQQAKATGWKLANGHLFRVESEWFVDVLPSPLWQRGLRLVLCAKPMAVDPLFWRIVGLQDNERLPLSFRANGAWVVRPPSREANIALTETDPGALAVATMAWATDQLVDINASSPQALLREIECLGERRRHFVAFEICLRLLTADWAGALALCNDHGPEESGGFQTGDKTYFDQARDWISAHRPG
jgi:hypothetical protein